MSETSTYEGLEQRINALEKEIFEHKKIIKALRISEKELSIRNRITKLFIEISNDKIYYEVLQVVLEVMESPYGTFAYINENGDRVVPVLTRDIWVDCKVQDKSLVFPREKWAGIWSKCLINKETVISRGPFRVPDGHIPISQAMAVPIIYQGEAIGNFMVANKKTGYEEKDKELLEKITEGIAPILQARLQRDIQNNKRKRAEEEVHILSQMLLKAQERERQMISYELHDRVAQELALVKINSEMLLSNHADMQPEIREKISKVTKSLQESIKVVRDLSYDLRPPVLDQMGLVESLFQYCNDFSENSGIKVDFNPAGMKDLKLDFDTEINLYRLVQEGLTNIKKHAAASHVNIQLVAVSLNIILRIEDNGKGFDVQNQLANLTKEKRMGIRSMEERVRLLQGKMELQSKPMQGTKIYIKIPYKVKKGDSR